MLRKRAFSTALCVLLSAAVSFSASAAMPVSDMGEYENTNSVYVEEHGEITYGENIASVDFLNLTLGGDAVLGEYGGKSNVVLMPQAASSINVSVNVPEDGYYKIVLDYTGITDSDKAIKLSVKIDGEIPFFEAGSLELKRCYKNSTNDFETDSLGNQKRPVQLQTIYWQSAPLYKNDVGTAEPYMFYLTAGDHTLSITANNGGIACSGISVEQEIGPVTYKEYSKKYADKKSGDAKGIKLQGEKAVIKSDISLYPLTDRTSSATEPFSESSTVLNAIGGSNWSNPGSWIEWEFDIEKAGMYTIDLRVRQNANQGMKCYRTVTLDGELPFAELESYGFIYNRSWYIETLSDEKGTAYEFYLKKGKHTIRLEATTGEMCEPLKEMDALITELNDLYHNIIMITGTSPDIYRDYNLEKAIPGLVDTMLHLADLLDSQVESIRKITGGSGTQAVSITTLSDQLRALAERPKTISDRISNFYSNISAVAAWANSAFLQPIEIDYLRVGTVESKKLRADASFFENLISEIKSFLYSFIIDYNSIGDTSGTPDIVVWTTAGRDQAEALNDLIDRNFNDDYNVSLKLVQGGLVESIVAGTGPDIALTLGYNQPVDFASRKILEPLNDYDGFDKIVSERFYPSAMIPYVYRRDTYALPETQIFNMMFYRTDVLTQLGLAVPETWDELTDMMAVLARNNLQVGVPSLTATSAGVINTAFPQTLLTLFLQNGVDLYSDDLRSTNLSDSNAVKAFEQLTDLYNKHGLPIYYDANNRFRTGETPIIIAPLSTYTALSLSAPEIAGRWDIAPIPGIRNADGSINRADEFSSSCCVMFKTAKNKQACWEFLKWWTSEQTQYDYGMEIEALLGISGRYITANVLAFERLPWDSDTAEIIKEQWEQVSTVPQVPGYYFVSRYLTNAISDSVINKENARVVIDRYADMIDAELKRKNEQLDALWN